MNYPILTTFGLLAFSLTLNAGSHHGSNLTDAQITKKINSLYHNSPLVKSHDIKVSTDHHTVTLSGHVDTDRQFERAVSLAGSVNNVNDVITENLTIKASKSPMTDTIMNAKVKGVFLKNKVFKSSKPSHWPITIESKNNIVYLAGSVSNEAKSKQLVDLAQHVQGVKEVKSSITVKP